MVDVTGAVGVVPDPGPDDGAVGAAAMVRTKFALAEEFKESVTMIPIVEVVEAVAMPEMMPVLELIANPPGIAPDTLDQAYGATPPLTARGAEYETPTWPAGSDVVVI